MNDPTTKGPALRTIRTAKRPKNKSPQRRASISKYDGIIAAAIDLLDEYNVPDISMAMISRHSGIQRTTIYDFFESPMAIFRQVAKDHVMHSWNTILEMTRERSPETLENLCFSLIDCSVEYFNSHNAAMKTLMGTGSLELHLLIDNFEILAARMFHLLCEDVWPFVPLSEDDPFRNVATIQLAMFTTSVRQNGFITPKMVDQIKMITGGYLTRFFGKRFVENVTLRTDNRPLTEINP